MKPPNFAYTDPTTVADAVALKSRYGHDALVLSGGQSLMPMLNIRLAKPDVLIDINRIDSLKSIERLGNAVHIGALVRQSELESNELIGTDLPLLVAVTHYIGHIENRHRGTVGGSLAHADSAAELPLVAVTLEAQIVLEGSSGERVVPALEFFQGWMTTGIEPDEILTGVRFPVPSPSAGWGFLEVARRHGDFALASAAAVVDLAGDGTVSSAAIGVGSIADRPVRASAAESALINAEPTEQNIAAAAATIADSVTAGDDMHATGVYRRHLATVVIRRAVTEAVSRAAKTGVSV